MIYLMHVINAQLVFGESGSFVLWINCHHPFYDHNPHPEVALPERTIWVGDFRSMFGARYLLETKNLKTIIEYCHNNGLSVISIWMP